MVLGLVALWAPVAFAPAALAATARLGSLGAAPVTEPATVSATGAYIDWSARELFAWGEGRAPREVPLLVEALPLAEQAALEAARASMRHLLAHASLLPARLSQQLGGEVPLVVSAPSRGTLRSLLGRLLKGGSDERQDTQAVYDQAVLYAIGHALDVGRAAQTAYADDGSVQLQLRLPLDGGRGGLGEAWMRLRPRVPGDDAPAKRERRANALPSTARPPTGIVVQARGLGATPSLWPRLVRGASGCAQNHSLYGHEQMSDEMLRSYGVAPFVRSIETALRAPRVADRAMLVRAGGLCPNTHSTLWIDEADADAIEAEEELLREGRVVIVVD